MSKEEQVDAFLAGLRESLLKHDDVTLRRDNRWSTPRSVGIEPEFLGVVFIIAVGPGSERVVARVQRNLEP